MMRRRTRPLESTEITKIKPTDVFEVVIFGDGGAAVNNQRSSGEVGSGGGGGGISASLVEVGGGHFAASSSAPAVETLKSESLSCRWVKTVIPQTSPQSCVVVDDDDGDDDGDGDHTTALPSAAHSRPSPSASVTQQYQHQWSPATIEYLVKWPRTPLASLLLSYEDKATEALRAEVEEREREGEGKVKRAEGAGSATTDERKQTTKQQRVVVLPSSTSGLLAEARQKTRESLIPIPQMYRFALPPSFSPLPSDGAAEGNEDGDEKEGETDMNSLLQSVFSKVDFSRVDTTASSSKTNPHSLMPPPPKRSLRINLIKNPQPLTQQTEKPSAPVQNELVPNRLTIGEAGRAVDSIFTLSADQKALLLHRWRVDGVVRMVKTMQAEEEDEAGVGNQDTHRRNANSSSGEGGGNDESLPWLKKTVEEELFKLRSYAERKLQQEWQGEHRSDGRNAFPPSPLAKRFPAVYETIADSFLGEREGCGPSSSSTSSLFLSFSLSALVEEWERWIVLLERIAFVLLQDVTRPCGPIYQPLIAATAPNPTTTPTSAATTSSSSADANNANNAKEAGGKEDDSTKQARESRDGGGGVGVAPPPPPLPLLPLFSSSALFNPRSVKAFNTFAHSVSLSKAVPMDLAESVMAALMRTHRHDDNDDDEDADKMLRDDKDDLLLCPHHLFPSPKTSKTKSQQSPPPHSVAYRCPPFVYSQWLLWRLGSSDPWRPWGLPLISSFFVAVTEGVDGYFLPAALGAGANSAEDKLFHVARARQALLDHGGIGSDEASGAMLGSSAPLPSLQIRRGATAANNNHNTTRPNSGMKKSGGSVTATPAVPFHNRAELPSSVAVTPSVAVGLSPFWITGGAGAGGRRGARRRGSSAIAASQQARQPSPPLPPSSLLSTPQQRNGSVDFFIKYFFVPHVSECLAALATYVSNLKRIATSAAASSASAADPSSSTAANDAAVAKAVLQHPLNMVVGSTNSNNSILTSAAIAREAATVTKRFNSQKNLFHISEPIVAKALGRRCVDANKNSNGNSSGGGGATAKASPLSSTLGKPTTGVTVDGVMAAAAGVSDDNGSALALNAASSKQTDSGGDYDKDAKGDKVGALSNDDGDTNALIDDPLLMEAEADEAKGCYRFPLLRSLGPLQRHSISAAAEKEGREKERDRGGEGGALFVGDSARHRRRRESLMALLGQKRSRWGGATEAAPPPPSRSADHNNTCDGDADDDGDADNVDVFDYAEDRHRLRHRSAPFSSPSSSSASSIMELVRMCGENLNVPFEWRGFTHQRRGLLSDADLTSTAADQTELANADNAVTTMAAAGQDDDDDDGDDPSTARGRRVGGKRRPHHPPLLLPPLFYQRHLAVSGSAAAAAGSGASALSSAEEATLASPFFANNSSSALPFSPSNNPFAFPSSLAALMPSGGAMSSAGAASSLALLLSSSSSPLSFLSTMNPSLHHHQPASSLPGGDGTTTVNGGGDGGLLPLPPSSRPFYQSPSFLESVDYWLGRGGGGRCRARHVHDEAEDSEAEDEREEGVTTLPRHCEGGGAAINGGPFVWRR